MNIFGSKTKSEEILYLLHDLKEVVRQGYYEEELEPVENFCKENNLFLVRSRFKIQLSDGHVRAVSKSKIREETVPDSSHEPHSAHLPIGVHHYTNKGKRVDETEQGMYFVYISKDEKLAYYMNKELWVFEISTRSFKKVQIWQHSMEIKYDWVFEGQKLVVNDFSNNRYYLRLLNDKLHEEKRIELPSAVKNPYYIWGLKNVVLMKNYREGNLWRLNLETEDIKKIY